MVYRIREHGSHVRRVRQERQRVEDDHVDGAVRRIGIRHDDHDHHHELGVRNQQPCHHGADDAANVLRKTKSKEL